MSTHIESGFFIPTTDFKRILSDVECIRGKARLLAKELLQERVLREAIAEFDNAFVKTNALPKVNFLRTAVARIRDAQQEVERTHQRDPEVDMGLSFTFFPLPRGTLGMSFAENEHISALAKTLPGWQDFHYQNSTDKPASVSAAQRRKRERLWDKVLLTKSGIPAKAGFSITVLPTRGDLPFWDFNDLTEIPSFLLDVSKRAHRIAVDLVVGEQFQKLPEEERSMSKVFHLIRDASSTPRYQQEKMALENRLIAKLSLTMLQGNAD